MNVWQSELGLYCGEFQDVDDNGYFDNHSADAYFSGDQAILPMVISYDGRNVGFAVLTTSPYCAEGCDYCFQEFYVVGYYRGSGVSYAAVQEIFKLLKGRHCAAVLKNNVRAIEFFRQAFKDYSIEEQEYAGNFVLLTADVH